MAEHRSPAPAAPASTPPTPKPPSWRLPAILLAVALPLLAGGWYAGHVLAGIVGPLAIATSDDQVAVLAPGKLYRLDASGNLQSVDEEVASPAAREGGLLFANGELIVSPGIDDVLMRCGEAGCTAFSEDRWAPMGPVQAFFDGDLFWFSETEADRVQRYAPDGTRVDMPVSDLGSPGSVWLQDSKLYIADPSRFEVSEFRLHKRGVDEPTTFASFDEDGIDVPRRLVGNGSGGFHAIFSDEDNTRSLLVDIDAGGNTTAAAAEGLARPVGIARLGDQLLVVDEELMQVLRIDADGSTDIFGDADVQARLAEKQSLRTWLRILSPLFSTLGVLLAGIGGSWLLWSLLHGREEGPLNVKADSDKIVWLPAECDLASSRVPRYLLIAAPVALLPATALILTSPLLVPSLLWAAVVFAAFGAVPVLAGRRAALPAGERIGVRGRQLVVTHPEHGLREFPLLAVEWDAAQLRPGPGVEVPLRRDGIALYHTATIEAVLLPQLNPAKKR